MAKNRTAPIPRVEPWVVARLADVARFFSRSVDTIKGEWRRGGMPGKSGAWDLREILQWRDERFGIGEVPAPEGEETRAAANRRRDIAQATLVELKARQRAGELVELEAVRRLFVQHINEAKAIFGQVPDRVIACLPSRTKAVIRRRVHEQTRVIVDDTCKALADLLAVTGEKDG